MGGLTRRKAPVLELEGISVRREGRMALDNLDLVIPRGENLAILGPNGSGKSTLVSLLTRDLFPLGGRGTLRILGRDRWILSELRSLIGIVSPDLQITFRRAMTARESVISGFFGAVGLWRNHRVTRSMRLRAAAAFRKLGIRHLADRRLNTLSLGEGRRVLIARALVHRPKALMLDEPCTGLDLRARRDFLVTLGKLARGGTTLILVTHDPGEVIPEIERVVLLRKGKIFRDGPRKKVLTAANLSRLYGMKVRSGLW